MRKTSSQREAEALVVNWFLPPCPNFMLPQQSAMELL
ncbi:hypothetical protein RDI58_029338 [Solanum bulbocastanum]|uniref:Uncharacterized protein n=1 Tax=Solanum bulbocastanum TaxID=147425 RepID=A0AAN8XZU7_SOLBU